MSTLRTKILDLIQIFNAPQRLVLRFQSRIMIHGLNTVFLDSIKKCPSAQSQIGEGLRCCHMSLLGHNRILFLTFKVSKRIIIQSEQNDNTYSPHWTYYTLQPHCTCWLNKKQGSEVVA